jgi:predicted DCC family thiol-disulfide oxidoreductase YuxK
LSQNSVEIESGVDGTDKENKPVDWKIKMLYDGDCPLCMREVNMLKERSKKNGEVINFVDICARDYSPEENSNIDFETAMGRIHAIRRGGEVLTNIAAFRALYEEVGLGWVYAITYNQPWASIADSVYDFWAKYRLPITGRPPLAEVLEKRRQSKGKSDKSCDVNNRCRVD